MTHCVSAPEAPHTISLRLPSQLRSAERLLPLNCPSGRLRQPQHHISTLPLAQVHTQRACNVHANMHAGLRITRPLLSALLHQAVLRLVLRRCAVPLTVSFAQAALNLVFYLYYDAYNM